MSAHILRAALLGPVAAIELPQSVRESTPDLCAALLEDLEEGGRLGGVGPAAPQPGRLQHELLAVRVVGGQCFGMTGQLHTQAKAERPLLRQLWQRLWRRKCFVYERRLQPRQS